MYLIYEPHTTIIDQIKQKVFEKNRYKYRAYFLKQYLSPGACPKLNNTVRIRPFTDNLGWKYG
jgi:hypothetical protein